MFKHDLLALKDPVKDEFQIKKKTFNVNGNRPGREYMKNGDC